MPELEAWEKVIITGNNGTQYLTSVHGANYAGDAIPHALTCQHCHGGAADRTFTTMAEAHAGMIEDPSAPGESACKVCHTTETWTSACDGCHTEIAAATANSLHTNLWGYQTAIEARCAIDYENLSDTARAGFQANCAGCHTTCGQCHISRPNSVGGGFPKPVTSTSHRFQRTPNMTEQCTACHGSRVGADFLGENGQTPDSHYLHGHQCSFCHSGEELHGDNQHDGEHYDHRYEVETMPRCEGCHEADVLVNTSSGCAECHGDFSGEPVVPAKLVNHAHHAGNSGANCSHCHRPSVPEVSLPIMQCQVCHSQPYKNCTNCHNLTLAGGEYLIDPSTIQFKIGRNQNSDRSEYDISVVRHVPVDPQTFAEWGLDLPSYTSVPTWKYASPHNVKSITAQTTVEQGQSCLAACHNSADGASGFLLRESDLRDAGGNPLPDYDANLGVVIPSDFPNR